LIKPLISVIIPVYNCEKYIYNSISSVLGQTFKDFELIIVNDGSEDNSLEIINQFNDLRMSVYSKSNEGQCKTLNYGLTKSKGKYIKYLDSDDLMNESHLELLINTVENYAKPDDDLLYISEFQRFSSENKLWPKTNRSEWSDNSPYNFLIKALSNEFDMLPAWQWLIPISVIKKTGNWNEALGLGNDFDYSVRLILNSSRIVFCPGSIIYYRTGLDKNMSSNLSSSTILSVLESSRIAITNILGRYNSVEIRQLCAQKLLRWLHDYLPFINSKLIKEVESEIFYLSGNYKYKYTSYKMKYFSMLFGWKFSRIIQFRFYQFRNCVKILNQHFLILFKNKKLFHF
jgi:glycosyltransferase involved in cell wall biosynthesis